MNQPPTQLESAQRMAIEVRVRYSDCDPMNVAHHSVYPIWMEIARTELLRHSGVPYSDLEQRGVLFVVAKMSLRYRRPAKYDQVLRVSVWGEPVRTKIDHQYEIHHQSELLVTAMTTLVCVDRTGKPQAIPEGIFS